MGQGITGWEEFVAAMDASANMMLNPLGLASGLEADLLPYASPSQLTAIQADLTPVETHLSALDPTTAITSALPSKTTVVTTGLFVVVILFLALLLLGKLETL